jgi:hypothetical protein
MIEAGGPNWTLVEVYDFEAVGIRFCNGNTFTKLGFYETGRLMVELAKQVPLGHHQVSPEGMRFFGVHIPR